MSNGPFEIDVDTLGNLRPISKVVLSLGSNMGDSATILQEAVEFLADTPDLALVDVSPVYQTTPVGVQHHKGAVLDAVQPRSDGDQGRDPHGGGQDGDVRGRPAARGAKPRHLDGVQGRVEAGDDATEEESRAHGYPRNPRSAGPPAEDHLDPG